MNVFEFRDRLIANYADYIGSFIQIREPRVDGFVRERLDGGVLWPQPLIQLNPAFAPRAWIDDLVHQEVLHPECGRVFRAKPIAASAGEPMRLHRHQEEAIRLARQGRQYVLTTGTGSGKSLAYIVPIVDHVLRAGPGKGISALVVYPMNALANSQAGELEKFLCNGYPGGKGPVRFATYTGQEDDTRKAEIVRNPPDILLTNYVMLEMILTRPQERTLVEAAQGLRFLVLDELHTYRGRRGADVALLVRRAQDALHVDRLQFMGTSATLAGSGSYLDRSRRARVYGISPQDPGSPQSQAHAPDLVPLYEAKLLHKYDHRWATYDGGDTRDLTAAEKADPACTVTPRYWLPRAEVEERLGNIWSHQWLLGFRDIARATDERTAIFSLLPRVGVGRTAPLVFGKALEAGEISCLLANMSALVLDYSTRQKIGGTHLTYGYLKQLPVLPPTAYSPADLAYIVPRVLELIYTAWDLQPFARDLGYDGPPFAWDDERRALLRAELDAYYARLYGLTRKQLRYILDPHSLTDRELSDILDPAEDLPYAPRTRDFPGETFRVLKDRELCEYGEYRTGRLVLAAWDTFMQDNTPMKVTIS